MVTPILRAHRGAERLPTAVADGSSPAACHCYGSGKSRYWKPHF
ncbi:hypothetical protein AB0I77_40945 [Streptomyces sp. NPDC050619]